MKSPGFSNPFGMVRPGRFVGWQNPDASRSICPVISRAILSPSLRGGGRDEVWRLCFFDLRSYLPERSCGRPHIFFLYQNYRELSSRLTQLTDTHLSARTFPIPLMP